MIEQTGFEDHFHRLRRSRRNHCGNILQDQIVVATLERAHIDHHINFIGTICNCLSGLLSFQVAGVGT